MTAMRIKYLPSDHDYAFGDSISVNGKLGWFHAWTHDVDMVDNTPILVPRAIVCDDNGIVDLVFPTGIQFISSPIDQLLSNLIACVDMDDPKDKIVKAVNGFFKT